MVDIKTYFKKTYSNYRIILFNQNELDESA